MTDRRRPRTSLLTPRQEAVLFALADGLSNPEIARDLFVETATVKQHIKGILAALDARNRTHAVALAYHRGILVPKAGA